MVFGVILVIAGAIMRYAVTVKTRGFNIHDAGVILLLAGIGVTVIGLVVVLLGGRSRSTIRQDVRETPSGQQRTEVWAVGYQTNQTTSTTLIMH
jgi:hypothetical protein